MHHWHSSIFSPSSPWLPRVWGVELGWRWMSRLSVPSGGVSTNVEVDCVELLNRGGEGAGPDCFSSVSFEVICAKCKELFVSSYSFRSLSIKYIVTYNKQWSTRSFWTILCSKNRKNTAMDINIVLLSVLYIMPLLEIHFAFLLDLKKMVPINEKIACNHRNTLHQHVYSLHTYRIL
jgi:hypothetical protein